MKRLEQVAAGIMLILAAVLVFATGDLIFWDGMSPGNRFVPLWLAGGITLLSVLLLREAARRTVDEPADWPDRPGLIRVAGTFAAICAFPFLVDGLGFLLTIAVFMAIMLFVLLGRRPLPALLAISVTTLVIYIVFISWLSIPLPKGFLGI